jgi:hypothetical protein
MPLEKRKRTTRLILAKHLMHTLAKMVALRRANEEADRDETFGECDQLHVQDMMQDMMQEKDNEQKVLQVLLDSMLDSVVPGKTSSYVPFKDSFIANDRKRSQNLQQTAMVQMLKATADRLGSTFVTSLDKILNGRNAPRNILKRLNAIIVEQKCKDAAWVVDGIHHSIFGVYEVVVDKKERRIERAKLKGFAKEEADRMTYLPNSHSMHKYRLKAHRHKHRFKAFANEYHKSKEELEPGRLEPGKDVYVLELVEGGNYKYDEKSAAKDWRDPERVRVRMRESPSLSY